MFSNCSIFVESEHEREHRSIINILFDLSNEFVICIVNELFSFVSFDFSYFVFKLICFFSSRSLVLIDFDAFVNVSESICLPAQFDQIFVSSAFAVNAQFFPRNCFFYCSEYDIR